MINKYLNSYIFIGIIFLNICSNCRLFAYNEPISLNRTANIPSPDGGLKAPKSTSQNTIESRYNKLISTPEGIVLFWGWDDAEENEFDPSVLTEEMKELFIANGLTSMSEKVEQGDKYSRIFSDTLARYYYLKRDIKKSLFWALKAAENGSSFCMRMLSDAYKSGNGVVQDFEEGFKWIYLGAASGDEWCKQWVRENGAKGLFYKETAPIFKEAKRRANLWMKEHAELFISSE